MNSGGSDDATDSTGSVKEIVSKIKSQGIFDQFRKECLADVDTKPAYQNLRQRVESYVARFLSTQKWSSKLNKNQLRNNLRKQINQSGMLNQGVERIIDQVVNPKIFQVIKPKIDDAVCSFMGIELKQYQDQLQRRKVQQQNRQQVAQQAAQQALQPLMSIHTSASPEYNNMMMGGYGAMYQAGGMWPSAGAPFLSPPNASYPMPLTVPTSFDMPQFQYNWTPGYSEAAMFGQNTSMSGMMGQQVVTAVSTVPTTGSSSFFPHPTNIPPPNLSMPPPTVVASSAGSGTPPPPGTVELTPHPGFSTHVKPSTTPPPPTYSPSTVSSPGALSLLANVSSYASSLDTSADGSSDMAQPPQPPPPPPPESSEVPTEISTEDSDVNDMTQSFESKAGFADFTIPTASQGVTLELAADTVVDGSDEGRPHFKFAWDRIATVQEDAVSDVTISSVHTSDLSSFEEDEEDEKSDGEVDKVKNGGQVDKVHGVEEDSTKKAITVEELQETTAADSDSDSITSPEVTPISSPIRPDELPEVNFSLDRPCETSDSRPSTPRKDEEEECVEIPPAPGPRADEEEECVDMPPVPVPSRTKKLLTYSYKYSSDEEESREEKKTRIAREKEERYQKRLQRRAELEAKKKEREEEKARVRDEKKRSGRKKHESETTDDAADSKKEELNSSVVSQTSVTSQDESEGTRLKRRKRKTKEEMKEQLKQQKVMERRLCRQRTRNRRYTSGEFESVFTEKKQPFSSQSYVAADHVIEESVEVEETVVYTYVEALDTLSPPTPTLDENPGTPTQDERASTPTLDEKQPPTPTMDEEPYMVELSEIPLPEQPIPIVKVAGTVPVEPFVHNTRSRAKIPCDESTSSSQVVSPSSDKSDGRKTRKHSGNSPAEHDAVRRSPRVVSPTGQVATRSKKDITSTKSPEQAECKTKTSKRYSAEDLYKPRISHRSPPVARDPHTPSTGLRSGKQLSSPFTSSDDVSTAVKEECDYSSSVSGRNQQTVDVKEEVKQEAPDTCGSSGRSDLAGLREVPGTVGVGVKEEKIIVEVVVSDTESSSSRRRSLSQSRSYRSESSGSVRRYHTRSRHRSRSHSSRHRSRSRSHSLRHRSRSRSHSRKRRCSVSSSDNSARRSRKRSKSRRSHRHHRSDSRSRSSSGSHSRGRKFHSRNRKVSTSSSESLDEFGRVKPKDRPSSLTWAESVSSSVDSVDEHSYRNPSRHHRRHTTDSSPESADTYRHSARSRPRTQSISSTDSLNIKKGSIAMEPISSDSELYSDFEDHKPAEGYLQCFPDEAGHDYQALRDARDKTPIDQVSFGEAEKRFKRAIDRVDFGLAERHSRQISVYEKTRQQTFQHRRGQMGQNYYPMPPSVPFQSAPVPFQSPSHFKRTPTSDWQATWTGKPSTYTGVTEEWGSSSTVTRSAPGVVRDDIRWSLSGRESSESPMKRIPSPEGGFRRTPIKRHHSSDGSHSPSPDKSRHSQTSVGSRGISPLSSVSRQRASPPQGKKTAAAAAASTVPERRGSKDSKGSLSSGEIVDNSSDEQDERPLPLPLSSLELEPVSPDTPPELRRSRSPTPLSVHSPPAPSRKLSTSSVSESGSLSSSPRSRKYSTSSPTRKSRRLSPSTRSYSLSRRRSRSPASSEESPSRKHSHSTHLRKQYSSYSSSSRKSPLPRGRSSSVSPQRSSVSYSQRYSTSQDLSSSSVLKKSSPSPHRDRESAPEVVFDSSLYSPIHDTDSLPGSPPPPLSSAQDLEEVSDTESLSLETETEMLTKTENSQPVPDEEVVVEMHVCPTSPSTKPSYDPEDTEILVSNSTHSSAQPALESSSGETSTEHSQGADREACSTPDQEAMEVSDQVLTPENGESNELSHPDTESESAVKLEEAVKDSKPLPSDEAPQEKLSDKTAEEVHSESTTEEVHPESTAEEVHSESTAEEVHPESTAEEVHPESTAEEVHSESTAEEVHPESTAEEVHSESTAEEHRSAGLDELSYSNSYEKIEESSLNLGNNSQESSVVTLPEETKQSPLLNLVTSSKNISSCDESETVEKLNAQTPSHSRETSKKLSLLSAEEISESSSQLPTEVLEQSEHQVGKTAEEHSASPTHADQTSIAHHSPAGKENKELPLAEKIPACCPLDKEHKTSLHADKTSKEESKSPVLEENRKSPCVNETSEDKSRASCADTSEKSPFASETSKQMSSILSVEENELSISEEKPNAPLFEEGEKSPLASKTSKEISGASVEGSETTAAEPYGGESVSNEQEKPICESESKSPPSLAASEEQVHPLSTNQSCPSETLCTDVKEKNPEDSLPKDSLEEKNPQPLADECSEVLTTLPSSSPPALSQEKSSDLSPPDILPHGHSPVPSLFSCQPETPSPPHLRRQDLTDRNLGRVHHKLHQSPERSSLESSSDQSPPSLSPASTGRWRRASGPAVQREVTTEEDTDASSRVSNSPSLDTRRGSVARSSRSSRRSSTSDIDAVSTRSSAAETSGGDTPRSSRDLGRGKRHRKSPDRLSPSRQKTSPQLVKERKGSTASAGRETRKQKQVAQRPASPRETRATRSTTAPAPAREMRSRREKSPPAKRIKR
ncbi:serine/arginine repetitive matrix protein 2-like [Gigantopelta aegis]|uniref:serine/arginine repetitive matrix protein 2-like n=1 Tax=Gigantopelta aegis TaxID=1735272 RepID=UPI001B8875EC|nr:serine/arginine repetitive matrix protein 2-like [Gigantopelta aegis]